MSRAAHVLSIQSFEDLRVALNRFGGEARETLQSVAREIQLTLDWLQERHNHWRNEVQRRQEQVRQAQAALARCRASGYYDREGRYHAPDCRAYEHALHQAQMRLREAEAELHNVQAWTRQVQQAVADYQHQAQRLSAYLNTDLPKASALLNDKITILQSYVAMGVTTGSYVTAPPVQAVGETFATAVGLAALGVGLTAAALAVTRWLASDIRHALGATGEELGAGLLREQFNLQEVPFNQPKHGFDRLFTVPGYPIIVMESKVTRSGQFHPGQTQHGEQGSPEWIAAQAEKMADPASAQWSPTNERIAALIRELGPENVPAVAVVIQSETGLTEVYVRPAGSETWQLLQESVSLRDALAGTSGVHPEAVSGAESERGGEHVEGHGGPECGG